MKQLDILIKRIVTIILTSIKLKFINAKENFFFFFYQYKREVWQLYYTCWIFQQNDMI